MGSHHASLYLRAMNGQPVLFEVGNIGVILPFFFYPRVRNVKPFCLRQETFFTPKSGKCSHFCLRWENRRSSCHSLPQCQEWTAILFEVGKVGSHPVILYPRVRKVQPFLFEVEDRKYRQSSCHSLPRCRDSWAAILLEIGNIGSHPAILYPRVRRQWESNLFEIGRIGSHPDILYPRVRNGQPFCLRQETFFTPESGKCSHFCLRWEHRQSSCHSLLQSQECAAVLFEVGNILYP